MTSYIKNIRNDGLKVRYFFVGEYGSKKGRAHWHCVLFWPEPMPHRELRKNLQDEWWPHGWSYWDTADAAGIRYVMKYINKEVSDDVAARSIGMSRKPILGRNYFIELATRYVEQGISPQRPFYKFREVLDKSGKPVEFYMPPLVAEQFVGFFVAAWRARNPDRWWPPSEFVDGWHDRSVGYIAPIAGATRQYREGPWMLPPGGGSYRFDEKLNSFYADVAAGRLYWSFDENGNRAWQNDIVTESEAERRSAVYETRKASERQ